MPGATDTSTGFVDRNPRVPDEGELPPPPRPEAPKPEPPKKELQERDFRLGDGNPYRPRTKTSVGIPLLRTVAFAFGFLGAGLRLVSFLRSHPSPLP